MNIAVSTLIGVSNYRPRRCKLSSIETNFVKLSSYSDSFLKLRMPYLSIKSVFVIQVRLTRVLSLKSFILSLFNGKNFSGMVI